MVAGAAILLLFGGISPGDAITAIDWNVIAYLFGVFSIAASLYDTGLSHLLGRRIAASGAPRLAFAAFLASAALCSAVLTNDAAAVIFTPIALMLAREKGMAPASLVLGLCAAVTAGSMASPVGNPQNILIAVRGGVESPVPTFALWLGPPALLSLAFVHIRFARHLAAPEFHGGQRFDGNLPPSLSDRRWPALLAVLLLVSMIMLDAASRIAGAEYGLPFGFASLVACMPVYLFGKRRLAVFKGADWPTLAFFVAMFVVTGALLRSGALQALLGSMQQRLAEPEVTALVSYLASQLFSNVPVVDLYLQLLPEKNTLGLMTLAGISTLAGNLFIISAASNVIVVQQSERLGFRPFTFWQFTAAVLPVAIFSVAVTYGWLMMLASFR
ncbi:arsenic resistance protein [Stappia sp. F7233]|uniref:Arsenic resistance protein n=2 Tax=Stappia albiluteola TaxID=2758565 RepID=A0A839AFB1_9HYPH|nr:arsenic resistance protein [Stappia albiluteola]